MSKLCYIWMLLLTGLSHAQSSCLPSYGMPVKKMQMPGGSHISYIEKGTGPSMLFIHGLGGNIAHWQKNIAELSQQFHCIAIDLPAYGHSDYIEHNGNKKQLALYAEWIAVFIRQQKLERVVLVGHSMGGQIAAMLALENPGLVAKLVLLAPAGLETFTEAEAKLLINATPASFFEQQDETMIRRAFRQNFHEQPADAEALIIERIKLKGCEGFKNYTKAVSNGIRGMLEYPVKKELPKIKQPVLVVFGASDALIPNKILHPALTQEALLAELALLLPAAGIKVIPNGGHLVQFEKPGEVNKAIHNFLQ